MTAKEAIEMMNNPKKFMEGDMFSCQIDFFNGNDEEVSFVIDCNKPNWRDKLLSLWEDYRKANKLPEECVTDAWVTVA